MGSTRNMSKIVTCWLDGRKQDSETSSRTDKQALVDLKSGSEAISRIKDESILIPTGRCTHVHRVGYKKFVFFFFFGII